MSNIPEMVVTAEPHVKVGRETAHGYLSANPHFIVNPDITFDGADFEMDITLPNGVTVQMKGHFQSEVDAVETFTESAKQMTDLSFGW